MIRSRLIENLQKLNDTEMYIVEYLTKKNFEWFKDTNSTDNNVRKVLYNAWVNYFGHTPEDGMHPFYLVWCKMVNGVNIDMLIPETDLYGHDYELLAKEVNELYMSKYRPTILTILKSFAERDFDEICDRYGFDSNDDVSVKSVQEDIESYSEYIVNNLDETDLMTIILFCGKPIPNLNS